MSNVKALTEDTFKDEVKDGYSVVDFWAAWCGPCRIMAPIIDDFAEANQGKVTVAKVDVDDNQNLAAAYQVASIPTLLVLKNGVEIDRIVGVTPLKTLQSRFDAKVG